LTEAVFKQVKHDGAYH